MSRSRSPSVAGFGRTTKIALLVKNLGNGFFDAANKGAQEAAKELGDVEVIYTGPTQATPEGQIDIINSLVAQGVNAIAVSANDADALVPALKKAMERGITVISFDSGVAKAGRQMNLLASATELIGDQCLKMAIATCSTAKGDVAILSATSTATNQNAWIEVMKKDVGKFPNINLTNGRLRRRQAGQELPRGQGPDRERSRTSRSSSRRPPSASPPPRSTSRTTSWSARCWSPASACRRR